MTRHAFKTLFETLTRRLAQSVEGQTLLEYAIILASVAVLAVAILTVLGVDVVNYLTGAANAF